MEKKEQNKKNKVIVVPQDFKENFSLMIKNYTFMMILAFITIISLFMINLLVASVFGLVFSIYYYNYLKYYNKLLEEV